LGIPIASAWIERWNIFANVVSHGAYGRYTARAQLNIGMAREKHRSERCSDPAYQAVVDKFPNEAQSPSMLKIHRHTLV